MSEAPPRSRGGPQFDAQPSPSEGYRLGVDSEREEHLLSLFTEWDKHLLGKWSTWREEAKQAYDFAAGHQWDPKDRAAMMDNQKIPVVFNITAPTLDAVAGAEIQNRQEVRYYPRTPDKTGVSDVLSQAADYVNDECDGDQEDSEAFYDCLICGVGWTYTGPEIDGDKLSIFKGRVDPLEIMADASSRKPNFDDARYLKREWPMSRDDFEDFVGSIGRPDANPDGFADLDSGKRLTIVNPTLRYTNGMLGPGNGADEVVVCEWQWWEKATRFLSPMPHPTQSGVVQLQKLTPEQHAQALSIKPDLPSQPTTEKVFYRAFTADDSVLFEEELPEKMFRYRAITGKRDRNAGTWFGLVRPMLDPQRFMNKLYSEILHIVRTNANGGLMLEEDAVADIRKFESTWAAADKITWMKPGSLSNAQGAKVLPKPTVTINPSLFQIMEFARDMVKACTGVNEEILGIVGRDQPGVLEQQRKQAAYGILSAFFDAKRRYQREQGRLLLAQIKIFLPDDTLVRILDQGTAVYIPIARALTDAEYDVVVDEAPAGPNQKAKVMAVLGPLLPEMFASGIIGAEQIADMLPFMDIPASVADKLGQAIRQRAQAAQQPSPQQQQMEQAQQVAFAKEMQNKDADTQAKQAKAAKDMATAQTTPAKLQMEGVKAMAGVQSTRQELQMQREQHGQDMAMEGQKNAQKMQQADQQHRLRLAQSADQHGQRAEQAQQVHAAKLSRMQQEQVQRGLDAEAKQPGEAEADEP